MGLIVTSPSSPALLPLFVIKSGRREQICASDLVWQLGLELAGVIPSPSEEGQGEGLLPAKRIRTIAIRGRLEAAGAQSFLSVLP